MGHYFSGYDPIDLNLSYEISAMNYINKCSPLILRNFNNECVCYYIIIGFNESFDDGKDKSCVFVKEF